jgi:hypothetical protein
VAAVASTDLGDLNIFRGGSATPLYHKKDFCYRRRAGYAGREGRGAPARLPERPERQNVLAF